MCETSVVIPDLLLMTFDEVNVHGSNFIKEVKKKRKQFSVEICFRYCYACFMNYEIAIPDAPVFPAFQNGLQWITAAHRRC